MLYLRPMDYRQRLLDIIEFLKPYQRIWQNEIMLMYPNPLEGFPIEWIEEIAAIKDKKDIMRLEVKDFSGLVQNPSFQKFHQRIEELTAFPKSQVLTPMPADSFTFLHMIPKKQHEIKILAPAINELYQNQKIHEVIDIGGGIGLLAQTLSNQYGLNLISLDLDPILQKTGLGRNKKNAKRMDHFVRYEKVKVARDEKDFLKHLTSKTMTVGLHTCGPLAVDQIMGSSQQQVKALINFGCCYHKLKSDQKISKFAQEHCPWIISPFALTLASRGHKKLQEKDYDLKLKVKSYRFAFHFLLHDHYNKKELVTLGNSKPKDYDKSFSTYALEQFKRIKLTPKHSPEELDEYFQNPERKKLIWDMLAAEIIRNSLGRLVEVSLLLDRVIYLQEQNYKAELLVFFDETISPRNLGIVARL